MKFGGGNAFVFRGSSMEAGCLEDVGRLTLVYSPEKLKIENCESNCKSKWCLPVLRRAPGLPACQPLRCISVMSV